MAENRTWSDWWSSRTIRFEAYVQALFASVAAVVMTLDQATLTDLGLDAKTIAVIILVLNILRGVRNADLRAKTDKPLAGRSAIDPERLLT